MKTGSTPTYRIHPAIGIARLGDSPSEFCISPETPAALPIDCDSEGNARRTPDGTAELPVRQFKDAQGRIKRQAARFRLYVYDEQSPEGRELKLGDKIEGGGNHGVLVDIQWRVHVANKKASWYEFHALNGEHGYGANHPRRNADITEDEARQRLIIDPGPQVVNLSDRRRASFNNTRDGLYAPVFPPELAPRSIDTLGDLLTDNEGHLLVLGGHGNSGSFKTGFGQPRIETYANNDGWFDDVSDGPVMARLVIYSEEVGRQRFIDVEYPAWVLVGYPAYVPEILDMVTLDDVLFDMSIREFAYRTELYGETGTFKTPRQVDLNDPGALTHWKAGRLEWNPDYKPWFYRDIWPILFRADEFRYLTNVLAQSNYPHDQSGRGNFDPDKLSAPPVPEPGAVEDKQRAVMHRNQSGHLLLEALDPVLVMAEAHDRLVPKTSGQPRPEPLRINRNRIRDAARRFVGGAIPDFEPFRKNVEGYTEAWRRYVGSDEGRERVKAFEEQLTSLFEQAGPREKRMALEVTAFVSPRRGDEQPNEAPWGLSIQESVERVLREYTTGRLLQKAFARAAEEATFDPYRAYRNFLYDLLRRPGEENVFRLGGRPNSRMFNLPLMPLLTGDNPMSNEVPSKFLRLTDYQHFILRQWAMGRFYNEWLEEWVKPEDIDVFQPYKGWVNDTPRKLDQGVLMNLLGGAFCPGGEVSWIIRNPACYKEPYRLKADPDFYVFRQTAAQANNNSRNLPISEQRYVSDIDVVLSQDTDLERGLQPGDLTKYGALPWQADFNECTTQLIDLTYEQWNTIDPASQNDPVMKLQDKVWETLWWPAHRPLQTYEVAGFSDGKPILQYLSWSRGIPQTNAGDLKMVTEWSKLGFVVRNLYLKESDLDVASPESKYISVERNKEES